MSTMVNVADLVFDRALYPRQNVDEHHVKELERAMEGGIELPPIIVQKGTNKIVDGTHRYHAALRRGAKKIAATIKTYKNDAELFREAVMLNSGMGLRLSTHDTLKVIEIGNKLGFKEIDLAAMMRTSISHLRTINVRYATVQGAREGVSKARRVALKGSVRHLSGTTITAKQENAISGAPGSSYLLLVRQLCDALEHDLLPEATRHPTLWAELGRLGELIQSHLIKKAA